MPLWTWLFLILTPFYLGFALWVIGGFLKKTQRIQTAFPSLSVAVVARDEEVQLPHLFEAFKKLKGRSLISRFLLVDDNSQDKTGKLMDDFCREEEKAMVIHLKEKPSHLPGKKWGITQIMKAAQTDFVFFTDADCRPHPEWILRGGRLLDEETGMAIGMVLPENASLFQSLESLSGSFFAFSLASRRQAPYCSGGNMAVSVAAFKEVGGYAGTPVIASGDDMFLLQKIQKYYMIKPMYEKETVVLTRRWYAPGEYAEKNKRKYGKNLYLKLWQKTAFLTAVVYFLLIPCVLWRPGIPLGYAAMLLGLKAGAETAAFAAGALKAGRKREIFFFPFFALLYPVKIIVFSFWGVWKGYRWKSERSIR
jgi:glycosyltransferase involved in cell wall biosynthesis